MTQAALILLGMLLSLTPCPGHAGLVWPPAVGEDHFRVWRCLAGTCLLDFRLVDGVLKPFPSNLAQWTLAGNTLACNRDGYVDEGQQVPRFICHHWEVLKAASIPVMNISYDYSVQTVDALGRTSSGSNVVRCGPQDPTSCYEGGRQVVCP